MLKYDQYYTYQTEGIGNKGLLALVVEVIKVPTHYLRNNICLDHFKIYIQLFHRPLATAPWATRGLPTPT